MSFSTGKVALPDLMVITGADPMQRQQFLTKLTLVLQSGVRLVQLRTQGLSALAYFDLAYSVSELCQTWDARLVLNIPIPYLSLPDSEMWGILPRPHNVGLHLNSQYLQQWGSGEYPTPQIQWGEWVPHKKWCLKPDSHRQLAGASCHNAEELALAQTLGLDYAVLSPVQATTSHPDAATLGWDKFAKLLQQVTIPVYALGGLNITDLAVAKRHGACGIAAISGLWPA